LGIWTFLISSTLPSATKLRNWGPSFPLLLGNDEQETGLGRDMFLNSIWPIEPSQKRSTFSDKSFFATIGDSLAGYQLTGQGYRDQTGYLPDLSWQGQPRTLKTVGISLTSSHWLETAALPPP